MMTSYDPLVWLADTLAHVPYGNTIFTVLMFLVVLGILVFVHEWGHFKAAKSVGVWVEEFAVGFGPAMIRWTDKVGTKWKIGIIPLGGYVHMKGQEDGKAVEVSVDADSFASKTVLQRAWIVVAGPLANFVLAAVVFMLAAWLGETRLAPVIGEVQDEMPAQIAGLQAGDKIMVIDEVTITTWDDLNDIVQANAGQSLNMVIERDGLLVPLQIIPAIVVEKNLLGHTETIGRIGVLSANETFTEHYGVLGGMVRGLEKTWDVTSLTLQALWSLLTGLISPQNIAGPLGIADLSGQAASVGVVALLLFLGVISVNLGIVNLLPIPVLDGGHLLFLAIEAIKGSPVSEKIQEWSLKVGIGLILLLVVFATSNDVRRIVGAWQVEESIFEE